MTKPLSLHEQIDRILDATRPGKQINVIVQMEELERERTDSVKLRHAACRALARRSLAHSPMDVLPGNYKKSSGRSRHNTTASAYALLGMIETLTLAQIQKIGASALDPLKQSVYVKELVARMVAPRRKSALDATAPPTFWSSRAMPLRVNRDALAKLPGEVAGIRSVHINRTLKLPRLVETDTFPKGAADMHAACWGVERIKALAVWGAYGVRGKGVRIGVLDTGVDAEHSDLLGKISHFSEFDSLGKAVANPERRDTGKHGTHVAGTIVGGRSTGRWIGVAPEAEIAAAIVLDGDKGGTDAQVLAGIDWALERKVDVMNLSLGGLVTDIETLPTYTEAILTCLEAGVPFVAAIGNEGGQTTGSPGNDLFSLSVGATDSVDRVAGFSGGRTQVLRKSQFVAARDLPMPYSKPELVAPGVAIHSCVPGGYKSFSGTSMATPHVAGALALVLSATRIRDKLHGASRALALQDLIVGSVEDLGESGQDHRYGFGRLDVLRAVDFAIARGYGP